MDFPCRFTDRTLTITPHGSGIKLTINFIDGDEQRKSVFLDHDTIADLTSVLVELGFGPTTRTQQRSIDGQLVALRSAADALHTIADTLAGNL